MPIICGNCKDRHDTSLEVRLCYSIARAAKEEPAGEGVQSLSSIVEAFFGAFVEANEYWRRTSN